MNYKQVIIDALFDANVKPFFAQHIFRKMQEAKKVNYDTLEFFTGCTKAIEALEGEFIGQLNDVLVRMEDQLEICRKKGSEKAAKRIQEQRDFITEDNFQMQITGYGRLLKYDIDLARRGVADAIELTKGDIGGLAEKVGRKKFDAAFQQVRALIDQEKTTGIERSEAVARELEAWAKKQGWPAPDGKALSEFFIWQFYTAETEEDVTIYSDPHLLYKAYKEHTENKLLDITAEFAPANPVKSELQPLVDNLIDKIKSRLSAKIWRAAFAEFLYNENYFKKRKYRIKTCNEFCLLTWKEDVTIQLEGGKKKERENHIEYLKKLFRKI
ncbi:MAG: hypothetical protein M9898_06265 [Chitinophagaceae bacterium]|nr:hypothetical protein [Chitinophagaceae bacterium]